MPLAHSGPKAFSFPFGSAKAISPACVAGRVPFVSFPPAIMQMFHVELFPVIPLAFCGPKALFFSSGLAKRISPAYAAGKGPFVRLPAKHPPMFHVELFSFMPLAYSGPKVFSILPPIQPKEPARLVRRGRRPFIRLHPKNHPNVPHGTFFTFQNAKKPGFVRFACFHPPASVL